MAKETTALRDRWTPELLDRVAQAFRERTVFTPFAPIAAAGAEYQDLRGLTIRDPLRDMTLDHVDLSHAQTKEVGGLLDVRATDCLFVGATLDRNLSGTYLRCRFDAAKMGGATIFGGSRFSACTFLKTDLKGAKGGGLLFERCDFTSASFRATQFTASEFRDCRWDGVRFVHASLGRSKITRAGFPVEKGQQGSNEILPEVILDKVEWLD